MLGLSKGFDLFANHGGRTADITVEIVRSKVNIVVVTNRTCAVIDFGSRPFSTAEAAVRRRIRFVRLITGWAKDVIGKDEVGSSNLPSSSS